MKKCFVLICCLILSLSLFNIAIAEVDTITFRDLKWYSHPSKVSATMNSIPQVTTPWFGAVKKK